MPCHLSRAFLLLSIVALAFPTFARAEDLPAASPDKQAYRLAIQKALAKQVNWDITDAPLADVVEMLQNELKIKVLLDRQSLPELGLGPDTPVKFKVSGVSAKSALSLLLHELGLTTMMRHEVLLITSTDVADNNLFAMPYDVTDLVLGEDGSEGADFDSLIDLITKTIKPTAWDEVGGPGSIQSYQSVGILTLVISQTDEVHEGVAQLLADLRAMRRPPTKPQNAEPPVPGTPVEKKVPAAQTVAETAAQAAEKKILAGLKKKVHWDFDGQPLNEVVEQVQKDLNIKAMLDRKALDDLDIKVDTPITLKVSDISAFSALGLMLDDLGLTFMIRDEVLLITSLDYTENHLLTRNYDISDLPAYRTEDGKVICDYDKIIETITKTVKPTTWEEVGGPCTITSVDAPGIQALVVSQTLQVHEEIGHLLDDLRKQRKTPLTKEALEKLPPPPEPQSGLPNGFSGIPGQGGAPVEQLSPLEPDTKREAIVQANNRFAVDMYSKLRADSKDNLILSPYSLSTALAMAYSGARGETAEEMANTLHFSLPQAEIPQGYQSLVKAILPDNELSGRLLVANRLWCQANFGYRKTFLETCASQYFSEVGLVNFERNPEAAREEINYWVESKTREKIKELFPKGSIKSDCRLAITNAVYFKDEWRNKFQRVFTREASFFAEDKTVRVQMMSQIESCRYAEVENLQILEKPYRDGRLAMTFLLPHKEPGAFAKLETTLSEEKLQEWLPKMRKRTVEVFLPRFHMDAQFDLGKMLQAMGMRTAFDQSKADFSGMHEEPGWRLWIDLVVQKARIEVNEQGAEAAAATGIVMGGSGGMSTALKSPVFRADHPFLFLLRDTRTGCILFIGRVMQPPREM